MSTSVRRLCDCWLHFCVNVSLSPHSPLSFYQLMTYIFLVLNTFRFQLLCYLVSLLLSSLCSCFSPSLLSLDLSFDFLLLFSLFLSSFLYLSFLVFIRTTSYSCVSSFFIFDPAVHADAIVLSDEKCDSLHTLLANELTGRTVNM